jgi:hypothetical protein
MGNRATGVTLSALAVAAVMPHSVYALASLGIEEAHVKFKMHDMANPSNRTARAR